MQSTTPSNQRNTVRMAKLEVKLSCWKHWNRTILNHKLLLRQKLMTGKSNMSYALALSETWALSLCVMLVNMFVLLLRKQVFSLERNSDAKFADQFMFVTDFLNKLSLCGAGKWYFGGKQLAGDKSEIIEWYISKS